MSCKATWTVVRQWMRLRYIPMRASRANYRVHTFGERQLVGLAPTSPMIMNWTDSNLGPVTWHFCDCSIRSHWSYHTWISISGYLINNTTPNTTTHTTQRHIQHNDTTQRHNTTTQRHNTKTQHNDTTTTPSLWSWYLHINYGRSTRCSRKRNGCGWSCWQSLVDWLEVLSGKNPPNAIWATINSK